MSGKGKGHRQLADPPEYLLAHASHARGDLDTAHAYYLRALASDPEHPGCLLGLGLVAFSKGVYFEAEALLRRADEAEPNDPTILGNLAATLLELGKTEECTAACERVLQRDPDNYVALTNLSFALRIDDRARAVALARRAVALNPSQLNARLALGHALTEGDKDLIEAEDFDEAEAAFRAGLDIKPLNPASETALARLLIDRGRAGEAIPLLSAGSARHPDNLVYSRLFVQAAIAEMDFALALPHAERVRDAAPNSAVTYAMLAQIHGALKNTDAAVAASERALQLDPDTNIVKLELCALRRQLCQWDGLIELQRDAVACMLETERYAGPFHLISMEGEPGSPAVLRRAAAIYYDQLGPIAAAAAAPPARASSAGRKLRIGYLSCDYCEHATATLIAELIERHDRSRFEVIAYCYTQEDEPGYFRNRLKTSFDRFVEMKSLSIAQSAARIRADDIDILVDLKGYTAGSRSKILKYRPAPIQVNYLGYPGSMGTTDVDYIIGDPFVTPMASADDYAEKIVQLPHCYQPNDSARQVDRRPISRAEFGLPEDGFVFCSFNNVNKLTRSQFGIWMRLLHQVPGSVLWMLTDKPTAQANLRLEAEACGIDPARIVFAGVVPLPRHIARMRLADLFLDSFPYTGHTTASEAMWAGLPLLTCAGESFASRVAGSILTAAVVPELVVHSLHDYEAEALALARDPARLGGLRARLATTADMPLFDIESYTRDIEAAYLQMARQHDAGLAPEAFAVTELADRVTPAPIATTPAALPKEPPAMHDVMANLTLLTPTAVPAGWLAQIAPSIEAKVNYEACPLCESARLSPLGEADITHHPLYKSNLPGTTQWQFCQDCAHTFADGYYTDEARAVIYPETPLAERAGHDLERQRLRAASVVRRIASRANPGVWLDVGFGNGALQLTAEEWGFSAIGLDVRADNVAAMRDLGAEAHVSTIEALEGADLCEVVSMANVLHLMPQPAAAIAAASRILKPDGILFLSLPNMDSVAWRQMDRQRTNPYWSDLEICHHFTRQRLYQLLMQHSLIPIEYDISEHQRAGMEIIAQKTSVDVS